MAFGDAEVDGIVTVEQGKTGAILGLDRDQLDVNASLAEIFFILYETFLKYCYLGVNQNYKKRSM